jgi:predicted nucleic acid-binding protein
VIIDSSSLISLAWSGELDLLRRPPIPLRVCEEVRREVVTEGKTSGHADAVAIEAALEGIEEVIVDGALRGDAAVLAAAREDGRLLSNDQALGRRARNLGLGWLRTADYVVLCARTGRCSMATARGAIEGLHDSGRITRALRDAYAEELR